MKRAGGVGLNRPNGTPADAVGAALPGGTGGQWVKVPPLPRPVFFTFSFQGLDGLGRYGTIRTTQTKEAAR